MSDDLVLLLPSEMWLEIASFLTVYSDLLNFTCTCKFFHSLLLRTPSLWNHFVPILKHYSTITISPPMYFSECIGYKDKLLLIAEKQLFHWDGIKDSKLRTIHTFSEKITSLVVWEDKVMIAAGDKVHCWDGQGEVKLCFTSSNVVSPVAVYQDLLVVRYNENDIEFWKENDEQWQRLHDLKLHGICQLIAWEDFLVIACQKQLFFWKEGKVVKEINCPRQYLLCVCRDVLVTAGLNFQIIHFWTEGGNLSHSAECQVSISDLLVWNQTLLTIHGKMDSSRNTSYIVVVWDFKMCPILEMHFSRPNPCNFIHWTVWKSHLVMLFAEGFFNERKYFQFAWKGLIKASSAVTTKSFREYNLHVKFVDLKQRSGIVFPVVKVK